MPGVPGAPPPQPSSAPCRQPLAGISGTEEQEARYEDVELAQRGTLWTWTIQRFLPKSPPYAGPETIETFKPYPVGYVELPGEVKVESRLVDCDPEDLKIGMEMELVITKFKEDDAGNDVMMFAFRPAK